MTVRNHRLTSGFSAIRPHSTPTRPGGQSSADTHVARRDVPSRHERPRRRPNERLSAHQPRNPRRRPANSVQLADLARGNASLAGADAFPRATPDVGGRGVAPKTPRPPASTGQRRSR